MFELNEAPQIALSALSVQKCSRGLKFFGFGLCYVPMKVVQKCDKTKSPEMFRPEKLSHATESELPKLIENLELLKNKEKNISAAKKMEVIGKQVKDTITLVEKTLNNKEFQSQFRTGLEDALMQIKERIANAKGIITAFDTAPVPVAESKPVPADAGSWVPSAPIP